MTRREFRDLAAPETVASTIESLDVEAGVERVPLDEARGRSLAERVDAGIDVPGFDRAAMDGYAVRAEDTTGAGEASPVVLSVVGTVRAGEEPAASPGEGEAVQIATGGVMPDGADAVVPVERTTEQEDAVAIRAAVTPGDSVTPRGADIAGGARALGPGTRLGPRHVGLLAALGRECVPVVQRPRVAVVSTGEELVQPGESLRPEAGQIYDVNSHAIAGAVESAGGEPRLYTPASDDPATLRDALDRATDECALVLTSGSTSAGAADHLPRIVDEEGDVRIHGVALKPGRPTLVGQVFGTPYVGLPGYPVSAMSVFRTFVDDWLRGVAGRPEPAEATAEATLGTRVRYDGGRLRLLPVGLVGDGDGGFVAYALARGSGATTSLAKTDGVVRMEPETALLDVGEQVSVERFDADDPMPSLLAVGEPDPALWELLDVVESPRFLSLGPRDARRWLDDGIPDALAAVSPELSERNGERGPDSPAGADEFARWEREWGVVVPSGNPQNISGIGDICDGPNVSNLTDELGLRAAFDRRLAGAGIEAPGERIDGFHRELPGLASAARSVAAGRADAGLGLRATADRLDLGFVSLGWQTVALAVSADRLQKPGAQELRDATEIFDEHLATTPGYDQD